MILISSWIIDDYSLTVCSTSFSQPGCEAAGGTPPRPKRTSPRRRNSKPRKPCGDRFTVEVEHGNHGEFLLILGSPMDIP
jgi:hypothetical protein